MIHNNNEFYFIKNIIQIIGVIARHDGTSKIVPHISLFKGTFLKKIMLFFKLQLYVFSIKFITLNKHPKRLNSFSSIPNFHRERERVKLNYRMCPGECQQTTPEEHLVISIK